MKRPSSVIATAPSCGVAFSLLILLMNGHAADWPQWRGANRDGKVSDFKAPATWPKELSQKWRVVVGDGVSSPALVGDRLFVMARESGNEVTRCLDAATGKEQWQDKWEALPATGPASGYSGPRSSPAVGNGKVITCGLRGTLTCFDAGSGKILWRKDSVPAAWPTFFTSSSPLLDDGVCIAQLGGQTSGTIVALDLASGAEKWSWSGDGSQYASPVLATIGNTKVILAQTDKRLVAVRFADGKLLWDLPFAGSGRDGMNTATPIVSGRTLIYSGSGRGIRAVGLDLQGDVFTAQELWANADNSIQYNSPVLREGLIYGYSAKDELFCVNAKDGKTLWLSPVAGRRGYGSIVNAGSVLFILTPTGILVAFEPNDKEFKQAASYKVAEGETTAHPIVAGSNVFVKDKDSVTLWTIE
ncbi:MAG: PQQ-like beta-propeller repeat protein [Verrucomicrobia bacterium]|nr:PQQ-like beta-propeller repeat protein [Verrucomicrobiota bacterium]